MNISKIGLALILAATLAGCNVNSDASGFTEVSVAEVKALPANHDALILDVRTSGEYASGHVPGAKNISVQDLASRLAEVPKDKPVYVYCESGVRSTRAAELLVNAGYTQVFNMRASMQGWRAAQYPIEK